MASDNSANAVASGKVETSADRKYPAWVRHDLERDYYDKEWGIPITHETGMLERVCLEGFQAGLSWYTVLVKRPVFREVFADFVPEKLAAFTDDDVERLLHDKRIIRNNLKIRATISNARLTLNLRERAAAGDESLAGFHLPNGYGLNLVYPLLSGLSFPKALLLRKLLRRFLRKMMSLQLCRKHSRSSEANFWVQPAVTP